MFKKVQKRVSEVWSQSLFFKVLPLKEKLVIVNNCVLWSHKLRKYAAMNIFTHLTTTKSSASRRGMRVDIETILSLEKNYT